MYLILKFIRLTMFWSLGRSFERFIRCDSGMQYSMSLDSDSGLHQALRCSFWDFEFGIQRSMMQSLVLLNPQP